MPGPKKGSGGRPPTATEKKRRRGTDRPDRDGKPGSLMAVAPVDTANVLDLTPEQALERALFAGAHWIAESDLPSVIAAREAVTYYGELKSDPKTKPSDRLAALKAMSSAFADLGFTPGERARLGLAEVTAVSKMEAMRAQAAAHDQGKQTGTG